MKHRDETVEMVVQPDNRRNEDRGRLPGLCMGHRDENVERAGLPGNRRDKDTRRTRRGTSRVRGPRTPGGTAGSAVVVGGPCIVQAKGRPDPRS